VKDGHIEADRLFYAAAKEQTFNPREIWHMKLCEECRTLFQIFRRLDSAQSHNEQADYPLKKPANF
jgi:hypothetical protein